MLFSKISLLSKGNLWEQILSWYQNSVIRDLLDHLEQNVFNLHFQGYDNFNVSPESAKNIKNVIIGFILGMILASAVMCYTKAVQGKFVRELLRRECFSPDTAVTLRECGFFCNPSVRRELEKGGALSKITRRAGVGVLEQRPAASEAENEVLGSAKGDSEAESEALEVVNNASDAEQKDSAVENVAADAENADEIDFLTARFYIPEDLKYRAEFRYSRSGSGVSHLILIAVLSIPAAILLIKGLPLLLGFADWLITALGG